MTEKSSIDTIVLDVGWVLVHLDFAPLLSCINRDGQRYTMSEVIAAIDLEAHERGELAGVALLENLQRLAPKVHREELRQGWLDMFLPDATMWNLARQLSTRYRVNLLSNVGELHWLHLNNRFDLRALAHDVLPSFEAGVMKPHDDIYRQAENRFQLAPARTVFVDDLEPNVAAARRRGWHAIQHRDAASTVTELRALGVVI